MAPPQIEKRKSEPPQRVPLTAAQLSRRSEIARILGVKVETLNKQLKSLTEEQRKALFYRVTHWVVEAAAL